jgi:defect in organelle trafficking protein DotD
MKATKFFTILISTLLISGCVAYDKPKVAVIKNETNVKEAETELADAAQSVSQSLKQLAEIDRAANPKAKLPSPADPDAIKMGQLTSIEWNGPVFPLVQKLAEVAHYKVRVIGTQPAIPVLVSIYAQNTPIADILRDVGFQCGEKASVVIYPASRTIELRYAKA